MSNGAIQFYGSDTVLKAFDERGLTVWAVFQARQMCTAGEGRESLEAFLQMLMSNPVPVYCLKVYKTISDPDEITDKTPSNGSFNFKLDGEYGVAVRGGGSSGSDSVHSRVLRRLDEMESGLFLKRLDSIEEKLGRSTDDKIDIIGAVNNLINDPPALVQVINGIKAIFSGGRAQAVGMSTSRPFENEIETGNPTGEADSLEKNIERMQAAIDILERNDPNLVSHLEKLAKMSQINKPMFDIVLSQLDAMIK